MLSENERRDYLKKFRRPRLENLARTRVIKAVHDACRKVTECPHCAATNGIIKKVGALKIVHEKWRAKSKAGEREEFKRSFDKVQQSLPDLKYHLHKAQEDINPLTAYQILQKITSDVRMILLISSFVI